MNHLSYLMIRCITLNDDQSIEQLSQKLSTAIKHHWTHADINLYFKNSENFSLSIGFANKNNRDAFLRFLSIQGVPMTPSVAEMISPPSHLSP